MDLSTLLRRPKTKIVCTIGPATESEEAIEALILNGMSIARLNFSHGTPEQHVLLIDRVRRMSSKVGVPVGTMADVPGTKYRTRLFGPSAIQLEPGEKITLTSSGVPGEGKVVGVVPLGIHRDTFPDDPVLVDDGLLRLRVTDVRDLDVICETINGGTITDRKGVVVPGKTPSLPFPDQQVVNALQLAAEQGVDFIAVSTVTQSDDMEKARAIVTNRGSSALMIAKVERAAALDNFDSILAASDAIMVARGDMGVEVPLARVPVIQKHLIAGCNLVGKPVITATQMLESMIESPTPTRAEVTDVANAIFDGTDAVMLSGETSVGQYPQQAVKIMLDVANEGSRPIEWCKSTSSC